VIFHNLVLNVIGDIFIQLEAELHLLYFTDIQRVRECVSI